MLLLRCLGWAGINDVEIAVAEYIDWFNNRRLHGEFGHLPPAEYEALHAPNTAPATAPELLTKTTASAWSRRSV